MILTDEQWEKIHKKYARLMYAVAYRIGGDKVAQDFDDSNQELALTTMDAVSAYSKKTGKKFDEFWGTVAFDKYIKTCLWNKKNNLGNKIKKKYGIRRCVSLSANPELFGGGEGDSCDSSLEDGPPSASAFDDAPLDSIAKEITDYVLGDMRIIKPDGSLNISKLSRLTNKPKSEVRHAIERMKYDLRDYNETV